MECNFKPNNLLVRCELVDTFLFILYYVCPYLYVLLKQNLCKVVGKPYFRP